MASALQTERPLTAADLESLPDDGNRYEIIGGELQVTPAPATKHQIVSGRLFRSIAAFAEDRGLGIVFAAPTDVRLSEHDIVEPDIFVVLVEHGDRIGKQRIEGAPDLIIEITSPTTAGRDRVRKAALYASSGVREYWLVDPDSESISVQVLREGVFVPLPLETDLIRSTLLDGLEISLKEVFAIPDWIAAK